METVDIKFPNLGQLKKLRTEEADVSDWPTRLFYIWISLFKYTNVGNRAGQSAGMDTTVK